MCRRPSITARAQASRSPSGAMPVFGFSGFCGDTSHQTASRPSRRRAASETVRCPPWAGLNDPPSRPIRWPGAGSVPPSARPSRRGVAGRLVSAERPAAVQASCRRLADGPGCGDAVRDLGFDVACKIDRPENGPHVKRRAPTARHGSPTLAPPAPGCQTPRVPAGHAGPGRIRAERERPDCGGCVFPHDPSPGTLAGWVRRGRDGPGFLEGLVSL